VSDYIDQFVAERDGRPPTPRWDRRPWSKGQCHRWYHRQKVQQASDGQTDAQVFRQCNTCGRSKPIMEFSLHGGYRRRECRPCRAIRTFRQREAKRREEVVDGFYRLAKVASRTSPDSPCAWGILRRLEELCGGDPGTIARLWVEAFDIDVHHKPGSLAVFRKVRTILHLMLACEKHERRQADQVIAVSDEALDKTIDYCIDRVLVRGLVNGEGSD
jgi:hypothetical protein